MGERATCPVCQSYSSTILHDLNSRNKCSICGCPNEFLREYQEILEIRETYSSNKISKKIIDDNDRLIKENYVLKTKISKLIEIFGYEFESPIRSAIESAISILHQGAS